MDISPGTAREEAERLVAAVLAAATLAANANPHLATGSPECCVCPLCKVIAAVRDPDPELVERVATGAGDLAAGLASFLRSVSTHRPGDAAWRDATAHPGAPSADAEAAAEGDATGEAPAARPMAKKAVKKIVKKVVTNPTQAVPESETSASPGRVKAAKKAVRKAEPHPPPEL